MSQSIDGAYRPDKKLERLIQTDIPFLLGLTLNISESKTLLNVSSHDLIRPINLVRDHDRILFAKIVPVNFFNHELSAYATVDLNEYHNDFINAVSRYFDADDKSLKIDDAFFEAGKFFLLSSIDCDIKEIIELYHTKHNN
ncbi:MAG: hypothetical protein LBR53_04990 [Deltaproteobacteria bacterium]|nr:hypothetical protein [Deltaproteobacteria bacterium]